MGQLYGLLYLTQEPMNLDLMAEGLGVSKGSISTNIRALERLGMVKKVWVKADRKDYYQAETNFMEIVTGILQEREKKEFDNALRTVSECLKEALSFEGSERTDFVKQRLENMQDFFNLIDQTVFSILALLQNQSKPEQ